jgi:DNA-binding winged helix-turn-helix (wHTH) protein
MQNIRIKGEMMEIKKPMTENEKKNGNLLYKYLMQNDVVSKEQMLAVLGWDSKKDRQLRDLLSMIGKKVPLIATSDQRGYKIAKTKADLEEVEHTWKELDSRINNLDERRKPLIKFYEQYKYKGDVV